MQRKRMQRENEWRQRDRHWRRQLTFVRDNPRLDAALLTVIVITSTNRIDCCSITMDANEEDYEYEYDSEDEDVYPVEEGENPNDARAVMKGPSRRGTMHAYEQPHMLFQ